MEQESQTSQLDEQLKGNVRIRLHCFGTAGGTKYGVELSAYNSWAGQSKLLLFQGGMDQKDSRSMFETFAAHIRAFDWHTDEFILE